MPQGPDWKQLIETGMSFTEMQRSQARKLVAELVAQGQLAQDRATAAVDEVLELSRRRREDLRAFVQAEIQRQVSQLGIATRDDLAKLERKLASAKKSATVTTEPAVKKAGVKTPAPKKAPAKKAAAKKTTASTASAGV